MESYDKSDPYKNDLFLKWQALWTALDNFSGSNRYGLLRRASEKECKKAGLLFVYDGEDQISAFHFYETLGLRLTFLVNISQKTAVLTTIRRIENSKVNTRDCLRSAAARLNIPEEDHISKAQSRNVK